MSERKRGFDEEAESSQRGSAKKAARLAPGDPSVDTSLSLRQPGADGRSDTEQLQSQAAAGRTPEEEQAVSPQGHGLGVDPWTQDLISAIDLRGTSSVNRQAGEIDGMGRGRARVPQSQGDETLAGKDAFGITGPSSCPAGGIDGMGRGRAQVPQSQGDETLAGKDAMGVTGPSSCPGNATGMGAPIPGIGAPPPPRPLTDAGMRQVIRRDVDQFMPQPAVRQELAAIGMQQRLGTTPRPGPPCVPPPLPQTQRLNSAANQCGEASSGITFTHHHDASPSNLHGHGRASAPSGQLAVSTTVASGSGQPPERQAIARIVVLLPGIGVPWPPQQSQADVRAAVPPPATTAASGSRQPQQCQIYVHVEIPCPYCHNIFPNSVCWVCANVAAHLGIGPHQQHPDRSSGELPMELRRLVEVTMANQPGPQIGPNMPWPNPLPRSCPGCHEQRGSFHPGQFERGVPLHVCLCSVCLNNAGVTCPVCGAVARAARVARAYRGP